MSQSAAIPFANTSGGLVRTMGLFSLIVYGVGDMIGSGIYGTVGVAAGAMGNAVWLAFVFSMVAALLTGLSYASIASRYPRAAGAAYVTNRAFHFAFLSYTVGLAVTASGLTSMAAASNVFAKNLHEFVPLPVWMLILLFLAVLTFINFWGIRESMWLNLLCTAVEVGGLIFIIAIGMRFWGDVNYLETPSHQSNSGLRFSVLLNGAVLTFFSFVGFEDMLNISEEVKDPVRTMPRGMISALLVVTALYIAISITAVSVVDYRQLADTKNGAPLVQITNRAATWLSPWVFTAITLFAVANTALINYIMGSRLLYGMSRQGLVPQALGSIHATRRTPHVAILTLMIIVIILALSGGIAQLASATSLLLLSCFVVVNMALVVLKRRPDEPRGSFEVPTLIPILGALVCAALIVARLVTPNSEGKYDWKSPIIAASVLLGIAVLYVIMQPKVIDDEVLAEL